ncbi:hypothetical protein OOJ91_33815 [Micromonospora lupini]|uniref:DUF7210 family protein n=1 Tax=Micromonospora lupini TaxID=285679 RepID=UPI0022517CC5|nr:hypothetical protein [Micromonospora lupini]MCX5070825.1 hypothetical protein [Micromonospora lupini]
MTRSIDKTVAAAADLAVATNPTTPTAEVEPTSGPAAVARAAEPAENADLVEVELTTHHTHNGQEYLPGATIQVTAERASALRWAGHAKR